MTKKTDLLTEEEYEEEIRRAQVQRIEEPTPSELDEDDAQFDADAEAEREINNQFIDNMAGVDGLTLLTGG